MPTIPASSELTRRLLTIIVVFSAVYQLGFSVAVVNAIRYSALRARSPAEFGFRLNMISGTTPEGIASGAIFGTYLETVDGRAFTGNRVMKRALEHKHPGDLLHLELRRADGTHFATEVRLVADRPAPPNLSFWVVSLAIAILLPVVSLALGFWVAAARPEDPVAWVLLGLMISFSQLVEGFAWEWPLRPLAFGWHAVTGGGTQGWLVWVVLFALLFPERPDFDRRRPWLKWLLLIPLIAQSALFTYFELGREFSFAALQPVAPVLSFLVRVPIFTYLTFVAISAFFALLWRKSATAKHPDARRRLRILYFGTAVSLTPMFLVAIYSIFSTGDLFYGLPEWVEVVTLLFLLLFPITMAYVIVVQRAMQVRMVLRQSVQYALARRGLALIRGSLVAGAVWALVNTFNASSSHTNDRIAAAALLAVVIGLRKNLSTRISLWLDKRFFREAYSAELVLTELSHEARRYTEAQPLLSTVARRVSDTLHIAQLAVFVKMTDRFCITETIGLGEFAPSCFSPQAQSVKLLSEGDQPELIYFDDPRNWVHSAADDEQQKLRSLHAEVLLALPGRDEMLGLMALGPKLSEEPYSPSDLRLLQSVAVQTGLALENTQLLATVAQEAASRERINREIEIAREVQQRLFPQSCPPVPGLDYFGLCRPALAVGGDYYDFLPRADGRIGLALGDISGKGMSAALMMASLHSLMRGQIAAGLDDLSRLMTNINRLIYETSTANRYATFFYGEYEPRTRELVYVNAGHNAPMILRGEEVIRLEADGPVVGLLPGITFQSQTFPMQPGDVMVLFTDGISEAMTKDDEEWGDDRLLEAIRACRHLPATNMTAALLAAADRFTAGAEQHDDMTLIAVKIA